MATLGTGSGIGTGFLSVKVVAADTVKTDLPSLDIIECTIPPVVINPQHHKQTQDQQAIDQDGEYQIWRGNHGDSITRSSSGAKGKEVNSLATKVDPETYHRSGHSHFHFFAGRARVSLTEMPPSTSSVWPVT